MLQWLAKTILRVTGWTTKGSVPDIEKAVFILAPHTSNWDGVWALVYKVSIRLDVRFFGKHSLFWFPLGTLLRAMGGIPLDRGRPGTAVSKAVAMFAENERFYFGLAPEGTRSLTDGWKSGFHRIAVQAGVPVVCGLLDYSRRQITLSEPISLSGDQDADLARIAALYAGVRGRWPEKESPIRFA